MSEPAFTKGPWIVHPHFPVLVVPATDAEKGVGGSVDPAKESREFAKQIHNDWAAVPPYKYDRAAYSATRTQHEEAIANARLIAQAPALYELLLDTLNIYMHMEEEAPNLKRRYDAAIRAVEGR